MDQSKEDTAVSEPVPSRREWRPPVLTRLPATLTANGGIDPSLHATLAESTLSV
jgi:hypothetical protein